MASNEYIIRILYDTPDGSSVGMAPVESSASGKGSGEAASKPTPGVSAASVISPMLNTGLQMKTQRINTVTGSGQLARKQALTNEVAKSTMDVTMSALGGASVASSLGAAVGITAGAGALVGVAMSAMTKLLDIATSVMDLRNKIEVESSSIAATKARASISWDRSRGK